MIDRIPIITIINAGNDASIIISSPAKSNVRVANVSKLNGRKISVKGNSLLISTKTKITDDTIKGCCMGRYT